ncbi:pyridoxamine 5'-phosphate oxidase family protein [Fumia xinanensis]|uniref:Pyridoxamine 5'-phosphate oxidase family protein n=1 Tax=Fumia xinanensis TaxID=2763659 RepID=A0A926E5S8_9FIRM|nr:pyridoxamine 5'-phosphate oxidase family protein [Fumia xinanensis]MBC8560228.1 pyridoxamine 5'-phosphate oxidase family protein [Fumia xinanensis]
MFREMRRKKQALPIEECEAVLWRGTSGVLAVLGDGGYPYTVPLSYVYDGEKIFFHCAKTGHKLDAILRESKVSFCVLDVDQVVPAEYTTYYRSVVAFGRARVLEDVSEKRKALEKLAEKYSPELERGRSLEIDKQFAGVCMVEIQIEHLTGKEAIELVRQREINGN